MVQDLRYALRVLGRKPLIAAVAVITLALGIAGATAVFSVVETVVLRPLPFEAPDRLVRIWELTRDGDRFSVSAPNYLDLRAESRAFEALAAYSDLGGSAVLADGGEPQRIATLPVSASFAEVLGVRPRVGHMFTAEEDRPGVAERAVVLSDGLWRRRFASDAGVVGRRILLDGAPHVVTGVMPPRFDFPGGAEAWVPLSADPRSDRGNKELAVIGRLAPGATIALARSELREIARRLSAAYPEANAGWSAAAIPFREWIVAPRVRDAVWVLFGAVGLLLLLACANVANLLVAQAASRRTELQIRAALGAARGRIVRQLLTESALLATFGTVAGVLIASWCVDLVRVLGAGRVPRLDGLQIDATVLLFACLAGVASVLFFGLAPAIHAARVDLRSSIDEGYRYTSGGRRLRHGLVVLEVALALLLLVSAGLMATSFVRIMNVHPGFDVSGTIGMPVELPTSRYDGDRVGRFYEELLERVRAMPGVTAAAATSTNPFRGPTLSNSVTPEERAAEAPPSGLVQAGWRSVTPGFFETMGIPVSSGRTFTPSDRAGAERVVVVSESLARRLWAGGSAVGQRIYWGGTTGRTRTVVGVVGDIRDVQVEAEPPSMLFLPHAQVDLPSMTIVARTPQGMASVAPALRGILRELDPGLPAPSIYDIESSRAATAASSRFNVSLLGVFAVVALVLAVTGVYAMLAFAVAERRREIAVRLALGADGARIARLVLLDGVLLAVSGIAAGAAAAFAATRLLSGLLYGVTPTDPWTFCAAATVLIVSTLFACVVPARQAMRVDAIAILRE